MVNARARSRSRASRVDRPSVAMTMPVAWCSSAQELGWGPVVVGVVSAVRRTASASSWASAARTVGSSPSRPWGRVLR